MLPRSKLPLVALALALLGLGLLLVSPSAEAAPTTGNVQVAVILAEFTDLGYDSTSNVSYFENLTFSLSGPSMRHYYLENSYGRLNLSGVVAGPVSLSHNRSYYTNRVVEFMREAAQLADSEVDYADIDALMVVHPGPGQESTSSDGLDIWSVHYSGISITTNEKTFNEATAVPEYESGIGDNDTVGVFVHEFGHELGLPDLYDTNNNNGDSEGIGDWGVMASGSWNNNGRTPGHFSAWSKVELGWVEPILVTQETLNVVLDPRAINDTIYKLPIPANESSSSEYFLLENARQTAYDEYLPGEGLLIWHIDDSRSGNQDENHKLVDLEEADGNDDLDHNLNQGDSGDPWTGGSFTQNSYPNASAYDGADSGWRILNIDLPGDGTVTFDIRLFIPPVAVADAEKNPVLPGEALNFTGSDSYDEDGTLVNFTWDFGDGNVSYEADPTHTYETFGTYLVTLTVTDDDGANSTTTLTIYVNAPPVPVIEVARTTLFTGEILTFNGSGSYDPDGTIFFWQWDFDDGSFANQEVANHTFADDGVYNVALRVMDDRNTIAISYLNITVVNQPPQANFTLTPEGGDTTTQFSYTFTGADEDGRVETYLWEFGDGANSTLVDPSHRYTTSGSYLVKLTVWDDDGAQANASLIVEVSNALPVALVAGQPEVWAAGELLILNGSASFDPEGNLTNQTWQISNGLNATGPYWNVTLTTGNYALWYNLTDGEGGHTSLNWTLQVEPRPVARLLVYRPVAAVGQGVTFYGNASSGAAAWYWELGDGFNTTQPNVVTHIYNQTGNYTVSLKLTSPLGLTSLTTNDSRVWVRVVGLPVASLGIDQALAHQGLELTLNGSGSRAGWGSLNYSFWPGEGNWTPYGTSATYTFEPSSGDNQTFGLRVRDGTGSEANVSLTRYVNQAAELLWAYASAKFVEDDPVELSLLVSDPDDAQTQLSLDWGDGSSPDLRSLSLPANLTLTHTFDDGGTYALQASLSLTGGGARYWTWNLTVEPLRPEDLFRLPVDLRLGTVSAFAPSGDDLSPEATARLAATLALTAASQSDTAPRAVEVAFTMDSTLLQTRTVTLEPGRELSVSYDWTATAGTHVLTIEVDPQGLYNDTNTANNQRSYTFEVQDPEGEGGGLLAGPGAGLALVATMVGALLWRRRPSGGGGNH